MRCVSLCPKHMHSIQVLLSMRSCSSMLVRKLLNLICCCPSSDIFPAVLDSAESFHGVSMLGETQCCNRLRCSSCRWCFPWVNLLTVAAEGGRFTCVCVRPALQFRPYCCLLGYHLQMPASEGRFRVLLRHGCRFVLENLVVLVGLNDERWAGIRMDWVVVVVIVVG